jgi:hypothetical protein
MTKAKFRSLNASPLWISAFFLSALFFFVIVGNAGGAQQYTEKTVGHGGKGVIPVQNEGIIEVPVSNTGINRIISDQEIHLIKAPDTDKIAVEQAGEDAHNAFLDIKGTKAETIYIVTESTVYSIKVRPVKMRPQTLHLVYAKKEKVIVPLIGNEREKVAVRLIKAAFKEGPLLEKARITRLHKNKKLLKNIEIRAYRRYEWDEDGLSVTLYTLRLGKGFELDKIEISEKMFLIPELCPEPLGIALSRDYLTKKDYARLFIVGRNQ